MKYSGIGGQAVLEGVMMRNKDQCAIAVRRPDGEIELKKQECKSIRDKYKFAGLPVIRGVAAFVDSLRMGMETLNYSASLMEEEEEKKDADETEETREKKEKKESLLMGLVMVLAVIVAIAIFVIAPFLVSESLRRVVRSAQLRGLIEGVIRVVLFVVYVKLISLMEDIKRVFMYHGAEHKSINCIENGLELTVENVRRQKTQHKRCGTSFLLVVMFVSILFFMFIVVRNMWLRMALRILLIPVIAGISYEFIRYAGSHDNVVSNILSKPGLWLQGLTTAEPDDPMIEVAIASVDAVFDWKNFVAEVRAEEKTANRETAGQKSPGSEREPKIVTDATKAVLSEPKATEKTENAEMEQKREAPDVTKETASTEEPGIEILAIDDESEEDDAILNALDRYFEAPK
ncbi:MAG: DUF1385 domain-containing protein [Eubacterium sp.]|nr:DUF1385 domain-containing protein [Eubacterium sp.]